MNTMINRRSLLLAILALFTFVSGTQADDLKARMSARLPAMDGLRAAAKVGENNKGFLTASTKLASKEQSLLTAENTDRKQVYAMIARRTGESASVVGRKRAASLRKLSKRGIWLQDGESKWYRKQ